MRTAVTAAIVFCSLLPCGFARAADANAASAALAAGVKYLCSTLGPDGRCRGEFDPNHRQFGAKTAWCAHALLSAGCGPQEPALKRSLEWLQAADLRSVQAVSMRLCAMAAVHEPQAQQRVKADAAWLLEACDSKGGYGYQSLARADSPDADNFHTQLAVMALDIAAGGAAVPSEHWRLVAAHLAAQQQEDGGWNFAKRDGVRKSYGSVTAGALAALYICAAHGADDPAASKAADAALAYLTKRFTSEINPGVGDNEYYDWLTCLARAARLAGARYIGRSDWYDQFVGQLVARQSAQGRWGFDDGVIETSQAVVLLARGRGTSPFSKLRYVGGWNARSADMANLARWLGGNYERPVDWQIVDANMPPECWLDSPVLYISGSGRFQPPDALAQRLRDYVLRGGLIVSEAAGNNGEFTQDIQRLYERLFKDWPLRPLGDDHAIFKSPVATRPRAGLLGVSNGVRLLAIHSPADISTSLQGGPGAGRAEFELLGNVHAYATDGEPLLLTMPRWPAAAAKEPNAVAAVARVKYEGNWDPEPAAWPRLAALLAERRVRLDVAAVPAEQLDANRWPLAAMTGTEAVTLSVQQAAAMKEYIAHGGTLVIDAAGGAQDFAKSVQQRLLPLMTEAAWPLEAKHMILAGVTKPLYRREYAVALGQGAADHRLIAGMHGGRLAIIFSRDDLTAGALGCCAKDIHGYSPAAAATILSNIILQCGLVPGR